MMTKESMLETYSRIKDQNLHLQDGETVSGEDQEEAEDGEAAKNLFEVKNDSSSNFSVNEQYFGNEEDNKMAQMSSGSNEALNNKQEPQDVVIGDEELKLMENKVINYILFLESQFYHQDSIQRE